MQIKISDQLNLIINFAREEAMRTGSYGVGPDHLFLGMIRHGDNVGCETLKALEVDLQDLKQFIDSKIFTNEHIPYSEIDRINFSRGSHNVLSFTVLEATRLRAAEATPSHLLLSLARNHDSYGHSYLHDVGIDYGRIMNHLESSGTIAAERALKASNGEKNKGGEEPQREAASETETPRSCLEDFTFDITRAASEGRLDPVTGREVEIERVVQILGRRKKNNPMLVGEPGVGKSAIVEGIALRIVSGNVAPSLAGKRLLSLDIASVVAGTKYRGDFEKRLKTIIAELGENPDIILFIDEFHTLVGAGAGSGSLDAANMLKPALARGEIQCIGATTMDEFTKIVEKDGALDRRFQKVIVEPADEAYSIRILHSLKDNYGKHHGVEYSDEALAACVRLSERYMTDRCLPDKAIDIMDEAGSMARIRKNRHRNAATTVTADDVAAIVAQSTGIPVARIAESEGKRLLRMEDRLRKRIIGQDEAIDKVVRAIMRNRAGIKDPGKPIGTFMFFGPTGVGKTQLAKSLAEYLFDSEENLIRIDMSEYNEKINASRLIGAPPGYVGFEEGGQLSEKVRRKPYCVVLLDEIEKAHPDIFNMLLQVLDEGRLTDSNGHVVSFRNTIVIMTSNVGSRDMEDFGKSIGFSTSASRNDDSRKKSILEKAVRKSFPPEFINRIDEQVFFNSLGKEDIEKIVDIELDGLKKRVGEAGYKLSVSAQARRFVAEAGFDPSYGARPLKRAVQKYVENPVSEFIITDRLLGKRAAGSKPATLRIGLSKDKEHTQVSIKEQA